MDASERQVVNFPFRPKVSRNATPLMLSPKYSERHWREAFDGREEWDTAINIVEDRIKGRWFRAADLLLREPYGGFALLAIDCIILESLWSFMKGEAVPRLKQAQVYKDILTGSHFGWNVSESEAFRQLVRNGLMHDAETRSRWLVKKTIPRDAIVRRDSNGNYELNRTKFHNALKIAFEDWVAMLRSGDVALRGNMRKRMNDVIDRHYGS